MNSKKEIIHFNGFNVNECEDELLVLVHEKPSFEVEEG